MVGCKIKKIAAPGSRKERCQAEQFGPSFSALVQALNGTKGKKGSAAYKRITSELKPQKLKVRGGKMYLMQMETKDWSKNTHMRQDKKGPLFHDNIIDIRGYTIAYHVCNKYRSS